MKEEKEEEKERISCRLIGPLRVIHSSLLEQSWMLLCRGFFEVGLWRGV